MNFKDKSKIIVSEKSIFYRFAKCGKFANENPEMNMAIDLLKNNDLDIFIFMLDVLDGSHNPKNIPPNYKIVFGKYKEMDFDSLDKRIKNKLIFRKVKSVEEELKEFSNIVENAMYIIYKLYEQECSDLKYIKWYIKFIMKKIINKKDQLFPEYSGVDLVNIMKKIY